MDLTQLVQSLEAAALAAVLAAIPLLIRWAFRQLGMAQNSNLERSLVQVLDAAAGAAYQYGAKQLANGGLANVEVKNQALALGLKYVVTHGPPIIQKFTQEDLTDMVDAYLGQKLVLDPTVSAQGSGAVAPPGPGVATATTTVKDQ